MSRTKHVNEKNTKLEILDAYQELLAQVTSPSPEAEAIVKEETVLLDAASRDTVEKITTDLTKLKVSFNQTVGSLMEQLTTESDRLAILRNAIAIVEKNLEERQKISVTAGLLERMIAAHKQQEAEFETMMREKRATWAREQAEYEEARDRDREREEEEYQYTALLERKRAVDERERERLLHERKKAEEQEAKDALMVELSELRKKVTAAPAETEKAVKQAVAIAVAQAQADATTKAQLAKQQSDAALNLGAVKIDSLEGVVKTQAQEIVLLKKQLDEATRQGKDIAVSVISNANRDISKSSPDQTK
ncbi:hypothetical protein A2Z00_03745 [Candidatus Gottesmanbacteria bacterium RBG_13_45_10]|uniref:Uncharacterized protein n=1 Tax=Candidatus Gottesmanbacteria bacterium RBG_13_45_10 TaxID=1798370 RepID=A0A1F5ZHM8_9BACT|nr:MAG: hypothetical protein A2Z00_03745 [Candidatus Gottesmanbacteria bacterium RBG_13_45_10]